MNKTILIGIDGMTWNNAQPWIQEGELPLLKDMISKGFKGTLKSTIPSLTCPALPSFYTGMYPTKTKVFGFRDNQGKIISSIDIEGDRFWDVLGEKGFKSFVSGVVTTYPAFIRKGVMISDPFLARNDKQLVWPPSEAKYFEGYFTPPINRIEQLKWQKKNRKALYDYYMNNEFERFQMIMKYLSDKEDFDFKLIYFMAPDRIQHLLWNSQELILECYKTIEDWIKQLIQKYPDHNFIIFSDHGFGPSPTKAFYVNSWLEKNGYFKYKNRFAKVKDGILKKVYYTGGWSLEKYLPIQTYEKLQRILKKHETSNYKPRFILEPIESDGNLEDHGATIAHLSQKWGLWIFNQQFDISSLISDMKELRDGEKQVFTEVYTKQDIYKGESDDDCPHIIFTLNPDYEARAGSNRRIFSKILFKRRQEGSHDNQRNGVIMGFGPDLKTGLNLGEVSILDLAPTILSLYGIKPLERMDGKILDVKRCDDENKI